MGAATLRPRFGGSMARELGRRGAPAVSAVLAADPIGGCMVAARYEVAGMDRRLLPGSFLGVDGGRSALCYVGPNVIPLAGRGRSLIALADGIGVAYRRPASVVGRAEIVIPFWDRMTSRWGTARDVREDQPLMVCPDPPAVTPDAQVRTVDPGQLDAYFPAAVAMFTEEIGSDPTAGDGGTGYRSRVSHMLTDGRAFARFENGQLIFKAEIGALSRQVGLIQGVWIHPDWRGRGLAAAATATVVREVQRRGRIPSLYVNAYNSVARSVYRRVGFHRVGTFASVLF